MATHALRLNLGLYALALPLTTLALSSCGGGGSAPVPVTNKTPVASLNVDAVQGRAPLIVHFDGTSSTDEDGLILSFRFDFDGDGVVDLSSSTASADFAFNTAGTFSAELQVTDDDGGTDSASRNITVLAADPLTSSAVPPTSIAQETLSLADIGGLPAVCYTDTNSSLLMFARASDAAGSSWNAPVTAFIEPATATSMAEVNGRPAILFVREDTAQLFYVRAEDASGLSWGAGIDLSQSTLDGAEDEPQLLLVEGKPAAAFISSDQTDTAHVVDFTPALDVDGTSWDTVVAASGALEGASQLSALVTAGRPAVIYRSGSALRFRAADNAAGTEWSPDFVTAADPLDDVDGDIFSFVAGGLPWAIFANQERVAALSGTSPEGDAWTDIRSLLNDPGGNLEDCAAAVLGGLPAYVISHDDTDINELHLALTPAGAAFGPALAFNTEPMRDQVLADIAGRPGLAYINGDTGELRFSVLH